MDAVMILHTLCVSVLWSYITVDEVAANVIIRTTNESEPLTYLVDLMAAFGPDIPDKGITGYIQPVVPPHGCAVIQPPPDNTSTWIALIARDNCSFAQKVHNAAKAGYDAGIVYNYVNDDRLVRMGTDGTDVHIPSVFVGWSDGQILATQYCYSCSSAELGNYIVTVDNEEPFQYNPYLLWPFAAVVGTCFVLMLTFMIVKWCRDVRRKRKSRLTVKHLKKIPTSKFKKGDDYDVCAICLDDYEEGDKLRVLPCNHVYHCKCVDPWLTKSKRSCPICKRKVIPGDDADSDESDTDEEASTSTERTPLLQGGNNNNTRSTFDNSGLPEPSRPAALVINDASSSDQSDTELGAVGGAPAVILANDNPLLSLPRSSPDHLANQSHEETVVIERSQAGVGNSAFVAGEDEESDDSDDYSFQDPDTIFPDTNGKDEKKNNLVV